MKIMFIPSSFPNEGNAVKNVFIYDQAKALKEAGNDIVVLHVEKLPSRDIFRNVEKKINVVDDGLWLRYTKQIKTFQESRFLEMHKISFISAMKKLFEYAIEIEGKPDILYAHFSCWAGVAAVEIGNKYNIPVAFIEHYSAFVKGDCKKGFKLGLQETVEGSQKVMCVSEALKTNIVKITGTDKQIDIIPNMIDSAFVYKKPERHDVFRFCAVGRLTIPKNYPMLLNAFIKAFGADEPVELNIGGDGELEAELKGIVKEAKREKQIHFLGRLNRNETRILYENSDCFVLTSSYETFGIVWREALAVGRPVITTDHGGWAKEEWTDDYGIMIPIKDEQALISALKSMRNDIEKYDSVKISEMCRAQYAADKIAVKLNNYFEETIENYRR